MAFDKIVGVDGTTYQFPSVVRQRIADNIETVGSVENLAVIDALAPALATKSNTTHNHTLASLSSNGIDELGDVEIGVVGGNGIALADKHTLQYESSTSKWRNKVASGGVTVSDTPPATPIPGDAWFDSNDGTLYVYYTDVNTTQWVQVQANSALEGTILARLGAVEARATALEATPDYSPNYIINGGFDIWQRGTSFSGNQYNADRWYAGNDGTGTRTISRQSFTPGDAPLGVSDAQFFLRHTQLAGTGSTYNFIQQRIENVRTLAGRTVTVSFWAKADASRAFNVYFDRYYGSGGSTVEYNVSGSTLVTVGTSWARYTATTTLPSMAGKTVSGGNDYLGLTFTLPQNTAHTIDIAGVQLEEGSVATPFRRNANSLQGELAACQRFYFRNKSNGQTYGMLATGVAFETTGIRYVVIPPVTLRANPTSLDWTGTANHYNNNAYVDAAGGTLSLSGNSTNSVIYLMSTTTSSANYSYHLSSSPNNNNAYIGFSAEL